MKKIKFFAAICFVMVAEMMQAQSITPEQLKTVRLNVYAWVSRYIERSYLQDDNVSMRKFLSQFTDESVLVVDDHLPTCTNNGITVKEYYTIMTDENDMYNFKMSFGDVHIVREYIKDTRYECVIALEKMISCTDISGVYAYPEKRFYEEITLSCDLGMASSMLYCKGISTSDSLAVDFVFHDSATEPSNKYVSNTDLVLQSRQSNNALITTNLKPVDFDRKMLEVSYDTTKNAFLLSPFVGATMYSVDFVDSEFSNFSKSNSLLYGLRIEYDRLLLLKGANMVWIELSLGISKRDFTFSGAYSSSYSSVDPDGGAYKHIVNIADYKETICDINLEFPVKLRYDYVISPSLSFYVESGLFGTYVVGQTANVVSNARYSGYYDWLFNVTIDQNGVYDFGSFDVNSLTSDVAYSRFGLGVAAGWGFRYVFPKSKCSIDMGLTYQNILYRPIKGKDGFVLSHDHEDWHSATNKFRSLKSHDILFQIGLGYHF